MKNAEPNCAAPHGLPQGRTPFVDQLGPLERLHADEGGAENSRRDQQHEGRLAVPPIAEIDRQRHRAAAADQDEGHDRDQQQRHVSRRTSAARKPRSDSARARWSDMRTVMYEIRKLPKMKVSLSRKIHIIGLPQGTPLKARWSEDTSATTLCRPWARGSAPVGAGCFVRRHEVRLLDLAQTGVSQRTPTCRSPARAFRHQHRKQHHPDDQQEMPVDRAQFDAEPDLAPGSAPATPWPMRGPRPPGRRARARRAPR